MILGELDASWLGKTVQIPYTQIVGELSDYDLDYEDEVRLVIDDEVLYMPREYPVREYDFDSYDPSVLLGVVDPWSDIP